MAFKTQRGSFSNSSQQTNNTVAAKATSNSDSKSIVISGMYDGKEGSKLIAKGMRLKEDVVIPAGYTVKLFQKGGKSKNGKDLPTYELVAQPAHTQV